MRNMMMKQQGAALNSRCRQVIYTQRPLDCRASQCGPAYSTLPSSETALQTWVMENGGRVAGAEVFRDPGAGFGLRASKDAGPGTRLIELPSSCHLTYSLDEDTTDPKLVALIKQVPAELWGARLALQLLGHRVQGASSHFSTYISQLPVGVPGVPMFFSGECIGAIEYPPVTEQIKKRCRWLADFSKILSQLPTSPAADPYDGVRVDINALGWAMACVTSRAFRTRGPNHPAAMLPLIDMANHSFTPNCEVLPTEKGGIAMVAKRQLSAGEPLQLSYGPLMNDFLFMDYGFLIPDNPHDRVQLRFSVDMLQTGAEIASIELEQPLTATGWRKKVLQELRLVGADANTEVTFGGAQHIDARLLAATRVLAARSEDEVRGLPLERLGQLEKPLNKLNETVSLRMLSGVAAIAIAQFRNGLDDDMQMLAAGTMPVLAPQQPGSLDAEPKVVEKPLSDEMRMSIRFRSEKKKILSKAIQVMGSKIKELNNGGDGASGSKKSKSGATVTSKSTASKGFGAKKK